MGDVVGFRPSDEERRILARTKAAMGFRTDAETLRYLVRKAAATQGSLADAPMFRFRVKGIRGLPRTLTSEQIDRDLYGGP